jgi:nucleoside-diphosphate-sugar epimerase
MRVLVTGGAGFIGSHVVDRLLAARQEVVVLDSLEAQGHGPNPGRPSYLANDVELVVGDVRDRALVERCAAGADAVIQLAAAVGLAQSMYEIERFSDVDDLVEGFVRLMASSAQEPINLENPFEFTMLELAELTMELTGSQSALTFEPPPVDDPVRRKPDITRAIETLAWRPTVMLRERLARTVADFRTRL